MDLSPSERKEVLKLVADMIVTELRREVGGDFSSMIVLPMGAVSQLVGISQARIKDHLAVTECATGKHGVSLRNIRDFVEKRTVGPRGRTK